MDNVWKKRSNRHKWIRVRHRIAKKMKNKYFYQKWYHIRKRKKPQQNSKIAAKKASKFHSFKSIKKKLHKKPNNRFRISVDICLVNNSEEIPLNSAKYRLIKCELSSAKINIYSINQKISYASYAFRPCYRYDNSPDSVTNNKSIYILRNDIYLPLFFNENNVICDKVNLFDEHEKISVDKTAALATISQRCWEKRNPVQDIMYPDWRIYQIYYDMDKVYVTLNTDVTITKVHEIAKFLKWKPYKKKIYQNLRVYDCDRHQQLEQYYMNTDGVTTYCNIPLLLPQDLSPLRSYFSDDAIYERFVNEVVVGGKKRMELESNRDPMDEGDGYWFCKNCFHINHNILHTHGHQCEYCDKIYATPQNIYYESELLYITNDIVELIKGYANTEGSECITNRNHIKAFLQKYNELKAKYKEEPKLWRPSIVYHWTYSKWFESIKRMGLVVPNETNPAVHKTDVGFYGKGIYTSPSVYYAKDYGDCDEVFVCLCLTGKNYAASYPEDLGVGLKEGFDSHFSKDRRQKEWVFFNKNQLLLVYLVNYRKVTSGFKTHLNDIITHIVQNK